MNAVQKNLTFNTRTGEVTQTEQRPEVVSEADLTRQVESNVVGLYPDYLFQTMEGYGCAMTETSCYLLSKMEPETRKEAIRCWFGPEGMDARFVRIHMDSCDYSLSEYQAVADPVADPELTTFSIDRDRQYILPIMREVLEETGTQLSILLSPWSPPAAWKTAPELTENDAAVYGGMGMKVDITRPGRCYGGRLKPEFYASWAKYLVKFVQAYLDEGMPVTMMSIQNEASAATPWDSCVWSGDQEKTFLKEHLYPAMEAAGLTDKIGLFIWDHNKERMIEHIDEMMQDGIGEMIEGFAYHWYTGDHFEALSMLQAKYPDKVLMHSESCGLHIPGKTVAYDNLQVEADDSLPADLLAKEEKTPLEMDFEDALCYAHDIIGDLNHGMNRWIDWNMMVDRTGGPRHVAGGFAAPLVYEEDGSFTKTVSYEYLKLIAKAVRPGAVRIGVSRYCSQAEAAAVRNTDGVISAILLNRTDRELPVVFRMKGQLCSTTLAPMSLTSVEFA